MDYKKLNHPEIISLLRKGQIGVLPTDTIYGIHASIFHPESITKIYKITKRDSDKPLIILISSLEDLALFKIKLDEKTYEFLKHKWPAKLSAILPLKNSQLEYLHRGKNSLAFRTPDNKHLRELLKKTGPLVSTSANPQGDKPAVTIEQAEKYFGDNIDFYVDAGPLKAESSTLIKFKSGKPVTLRQGSVKI